MDSVHGLHGVLAAGLSLLAAEKALAVLIETHVGHLNVTGMNGDLGLLTVHLLSLDLLNMDAPSATVDLGDFALTSFVRATHNLHSVSVADGDASGEPLCRKVLAKLSRHNLTAERGGGREVGLAGLSALAGHACSNIRVSNTNWHTTWGGAWRKTALSGSSDDSLPTD